MLRQISCCPSDAGRAQQTEPAMHVTLIWSSPQAVGALATAKVAPPLVVANTRAGAWLSAGTTSTQCLTSAQAKLPAVDVGRLRSVARTVSGPIRLRVHVRPASRVENSHVTDDAYPPTFPRSRPRQSTPEQRGKPLRRDNYSIRPGPADLPVRVARSRKSCSPKRSRRPTSPRTLAGPRKTHAFSVMQAACRPMTL